MLGWFCAALCTIAAEGQDLTGIKCIVDGTRTCQPEWSQKYLDGDLYFCSGDAAKSFRQQMEASPSSQQALKIRAHHQLLLTGQYVQRVCPVTFRPVHSGVSARIGGLEIAFADQASRDQVLEEPRLADKARRILNPKVFAVAFAPVSGPQVAARPAESSVQDFE